MRATVKPTLVAAITLLIALAALSCARQGHRRAQEDAPPSPGTDFGRPMVAEDRACIDLNSATHEELMTLPGVGKVTASKIIEFRERHGPFRRPQDIIIIHGLSERKYRKLAEFVCAR